MTLFYLLKRKPLCAALLKHCSLFTGPLRTMRDSSTQETWPFFIFVWVVNSLGNCLSVQSASIQTYGWFFALTYDNRAILLLLNCSGSGLGCISWCLHPFAILPLLYVQKLCSRFLTRWETPCSSRTSSPPVLEGAFTRGWSKTPRSGCQLCLATCFWH